jgi:hypothetical protein
MSRFLARLAPAGQLPSRRDWLRLGIPAALAATGGRAVGAPGARAKSVLVVFTSGGQSQFETWDPKPDAPEEIRGAFGSIPTVVPGLRFCEYLPRLAKLANRFTVLRSMTHDDLDHGSACYLALTGQFHPRKSSNPPPRPTDFPTLGAVLHRVRPTDRFPHSAFHINGPLLTPREPGPGQFGGFLGRGYDPLELGDVTHGTNLLATMSRPAGMNETRFAERKSLAGALDTAGDRFADAGHLALMRKAYELIDSPRVRAAFDLGREPAKVRDRYGRYRAGQACLLARRLIEAGVPWVTAFFNHNIRGQDVHPDETDHYGWDTHNDIFEAMRQHLLPRFDHSFSTLLADLDERGLLKDTLVICMGEFGRAPLVALEKNFAGTTPGRKHWARCYSIVLAGAGVRRGAVYGASDRHAAYPQANPVTPGDIAATLFQALGIDPAGWYTDLTGRPFRTATGEPVAGLFG